VVIFAFRHTVIHFEKFLRAGDAFRGRVPGAGVAGAGAGAGVPGQHRSIRRASSRFGRSSSRGFTMLELLAVIVIIGIVAVGASPSFVNLMRDRRVDSVASQVTDVYRIARTRAMGRGSAVTVIFDNGAKLSTPTNPTGHITMREAITGVGLAGQLPSTSCFSTNWANGSTTSKFVFAFEDRFKDYEPAKTSFVNPAGVTVQRAEICYTPRGRSFIRYVNGGIWQPLMGVPTIRVLNSKSGMTRVVVLPPNGAARVHKEL